MWASETNNSCHVSLSLRAWRNERFRIWRDMLLTLVSPSRCVLSKSLNVHFISRAHVLIQTTLWSFFLLYHFICNVWIQHKQCYSTRISFKGNSKHYSLRQMFFGWQSLLIVTVYPLTWRPEELYNQTIIAVMATPPEFFPPITLCWLIKQPITTPWRHPDNRFRATPYLVR